MKALIQRVSKACVSIEGQVHSEIGAGMLIFLGISESDTQDDALVLWNKAYGLRIFEDDEGKTNLSLADTGGSCMIVSQFTLYADCRKGRRPSFTKAMSPASAQSIYEHFIDIAKHDVSSIAQGQFGAMMEVELVNDGPFTIMLDTDELSKRTPS